MQQRHRILEAARECVLQRGFHAASMADIAATASMSVGQLYRLFSGKEGIMRSVVERVLDRRLVKLLKGGIGAETAQSMAEFLDTRLREFREDDLLMLEVIVEATRNEAIADIVAAAEWPRSAEARSSFHQSHPTLSEDEVGARVELLAILAEGIVARRLTSRYAGGPAMRGLFYSITERVLMRPA